MELLQQVIILFACNLSIDIFIFCAFIYMIIIHCFNCGIVYFIVGEISQQLKYFRTEFKLIFENSICFSIL